MYINFCIYKCVCVEKNAYLFYKPLKKICTVTCNKHVNFKTSVQN